MRKAFLVMILAPGGKRPARPRASAGLECSSHGSRGSEVKYDTQSVPFKVARSHVLCSAVMSSEEMKGTAFLGKKIFK